MSDPRLAEVRCFNENSPRPPVPGEERTGYPGGGRCHSSSPDPHQQPRRSSASDATSAPLGFEPEGRCDLRACMDDEQQRRRRSESASPPLACLQWSRSLHSLLQDPKGLKLFEHFLQLEGYNETLSFWFACEGLKEEHDPKKLPSIIKILFRRFFQRQHQLALSPTMRQDMTERFREGKADSAFFEPAHREIEQHLENTSYPNFLHSDVYLHYVRQCQSAELAASRQRRQQQQQQQQQHGEDVAAEATTTVAAAASAGPDEEPLNKCSGSSPDEPEPSCTSSLLPTLHEDSEFTSQRQLHQHHHAHTQQQQHHHHHSAQHQQQVTTGTGTATEFGGCSRLTKDMLMATQQLRAHEVRPKPEAFAGLYLQPGASPYHASVARPRPAHYSSYNPVSRQDSELQSLSSDARTESDNLSLTDASLDGASMAKRANRRQYQQQYQQIKRSAQINRDPAGHEAIIPRTQRVTPEQTQPKKPDIFARDLTERLEKLQRELETNERLQRKLNTVEQPSDRSDLGQPSSGPQSQLHHQHQPASADSSRSLTLALHEKFQLDEDSSDQAILDQHVSRVWSDLTPSRSPKLASPRPRSPDKQLRGTGGVTTAAGLPQHQPAVIQRALSTSSSGYRSQRKEKDVFSTFSGDSGNVNDYVEAGELHGAGSMSSLGSHLPKSKSVPSDYADSLHKQGLYLQGQDQRYRSRLDGGARTSVTKKSMTELTDSGVSVVSDVPPPVKDSRLLSWLKENDEAAAASAAAGNAGKLGRKPKLMQPFIGDPGMPLLPVPNTATCLDEAKRRLEQEHQKQGRQQQHQQQQQQFQQQQHQQIQQQQQQRYPGSSAELVAPPTAQTTCLQPSNQSTLRRGGSGNAKQEAPGGHFTTVVFSFCEEKFPYRTKISGHNVTLKQFKDVLPKKGNYRYFFKTECEDLDMKVIQEEVTDDAEVLPLWEGKVMAQVKALE